MSIILTTINNYILEILFIDHPYYANACIKLEMTSSTESQNKKENQRETQVNLENF